MALCASSQVSATAQPTRLMPSICTQSVMPVIAASTTASNFQLLLFFHMHICMYLNIYPTISWTSGCVAHCSRDKKWGKKRWNNFGNKMPFMTCSSQTDQHSSGSASLASEMASTRSHQPRQFTVESTGQIPGRVGSGPYVARWEKPLTEEMLP